MIIETIAAHGLELRAFCDVKAVTKFLSVEELVEGIREQSQGYAAKLIEFARDVP